MKTETTTETVVMTNKMMEADKNPLVISEELPGVICQREARRRRRTLQQPDSFRSNERNKDEQGSDNDQYNNNQPLVITRCACHGEPRKRRRTMQQPDSFWSSEKKEGQTG